MPTGKTGNVVRRRYLSCIVTVHHHQNMHSGSHLPIYSVRGHVKSFLKYRVDVYSTSVVLVISGYRTQCWIKTLLLPIAGGPGEGHCYGVK